MNLNFEKELGQPCLNLYPIFICGILSAFQKHLHPHCRGNAESDARGAIPGAREEAVRAGQERHRQHGADGVSGSITRSIGVVDLGSQSFIL